MRNLISTPIRVYIVMAVLAMIGLIASTKLPISLFPDSLQPQVYVSVPYGSLSPEEFRRLYGARLESELENITAPGLRLEKQEINYRSNHFVSRLTFNWGSNAELALRESQQVVQSIGATLPEESRREMGVGPMNDGAFFAMSFYSKQRSLTELHKILEPLLIPKMTKIRDANGVSLWNPSSREIKVELRPDVLAAIGLPPNVIESTIQSALGTLRGGSVENKGHRLPVSMKKQVNDLVDLRQIMVSLPQGGNLPLGDIADIRFEANSQNSESFKTSGVSSLILFASPRQGGNVKAMAEGILQVVEETKASFPPDVEMRVLVDPSFYIRAAIHSVMFEVLIGSLLASLVLFLFIGSLRNVATTAIEIPISIALAFIMMWIFHININLLSLAGLALAAGMNVDASVVVLENIFRHFEEAKGELTAARKLDIIMEAVEEVKLPVIASTLASLVVFVPFMFISGLSYAVLGDLAKAVIFSHGFSAVVALILVPTVRLHLMKKEPYFKHRKPPIEGVLVYFERWYLTSLHALLKRPKAIWSSLLGILALLAAVLLLIVPRLPKEIIGKPETDWLIIQIGTQSNSQIKQMEAIVQKLEHDILADMQDEIVYTFDQVHGPNDANIQARLRDKSHMERVRKKIESRVGNSGSTRITIDEWNPSEFRIPDPPQIRAAITGGAAEDRLLAARDLKQVIDSQKGFTDIWANPGTDDSASIEILPHRDQWNMLAQDGFLWTPESVTDAIRVATQGKWIGELLLDQVNTPIVMRYPEGVLSSVADLGSYPLKVKGDLIPLRALADIERLDQQQAFYVESGRILAMVQAHGHPEVITRSKLEQTQAAVKKWIAEDLPKLKLGPLTVQLEDPQKDITDAMNQLLIAFVCSLGLIFLTMVIQFGSMIESFLVLTAVPLGLIGALASLFVFRSSLSVNAALGMILLNGIAVNNSIILVDFARRLAEQGRGPIDACMEAAKQRLRPILITSLTTILGMMPIALGLGTGGRVLQPLGIAVGGGLGLSMLLTLFIVPALQSLYLKHVIQATGALALDLHPVEGSVK